MSTTPPTTPSEETQKKEAALKEEIQSYSSLAVAYSGGLDSAYLADVAHEVLGERARMMIADSPSIPRSELREAIALAKERSWNLQIIQTKEHHNPDYLENKGDRCFHCKTELFSRMQTLLNSLEGITLAHGAVEDDKGDIRPGTKAAANHEVVAPLQNAHLFKAEIRALSARRGLPTAEKASFACLGSRFPTGTPIQLEWMEKIELAEEVLKTRGYHQYRVRHHGELCRIEIEPTDFPKLLSEHAEITTAIKALGYRFVTLDLSGYTMGSSAAPPA